MNRRDFIKTAGALTLGLMLDGQNLTEAKPAMKISAVKLFDGGFMMKLVYLIQVPFSSIGWQIFTYYKYWFIWTILTIPMGYLGYYIKKDKWWGLLILTPILLLVGYEYYRYLGQTIYSFPYHILTTIFCFITVILYPLMLFNNKKNKRIGVATSILILILSTAFFLYNGKVSYNTTILVSGGSEEITFDDNYKIYLKDDSFGKVYIVYDKNIEDYMVNAEFVKTGNTEFIIESPDGNKTIFEIDIKRDKYDLTKK